MEKSDRLFWSVLIMALINAFCYNESGHHLVPVFDASHPSCTVPDFTFSGMLYLLYPETLHVYIMPFELVSTLSEAISSVGWRRNSSSGSMLIRQVTEAQLLTGSDVIPCLTLWCDVS